MKLFWVGIIITFFYFFILVVTVYGLRLELMQNWNEFGDFLAGAFSPVAFLWLVLGFVQQQKELQQNTEALKLQADELKNSVDQYKQMVSIAREQLLADANQLEENKKIREIETKPDIRIQRIGWVGKSGDRYTYKLPVYSDEREARNVVIQFTNHFGMYKNFAYGVLKVGSILPENVMRFNDIPDEVEVFISFESVIGKKYKHRYRYFDMFDGNYNKMEHQELVPD